MAKYCGTCGMENRDTARFCQNCALPLSDGASGAICTRCGSPNRSNARYCQSCGAVLTGQAGVGPTPPPLAGQTGMLPANMMLNGRYIIIARVGQGGMGAVYKATDTQLNRIVAVKELSESGAANQTEREEARAGFRREAEMLRRLSHRNLPRVWDSFQDAGKQYLVMDFVNGETLEETLSRSPRGLPVAEIVKFADQLCDVLDYLHGQNPPVIFRDLKPGNIMINAAGEVKLIDFGIARLFAAGKRTDTTALGTTGFAPPEQYGRGQTDARSDVYALGATLHYLLTGKDPSENPFSFQPVRSIRSDVPAPVEKAIMTAVEQDPGKRWQTASAMKAALHAAPVKPPIAAPQPVPAASPAYTPPKPAPAVVSPAPQAPIPQRTPAGGNNAAPGAAVRAAPAPAKASGGSIGWFAAVLLGVVIGAGVIFGRQALNWQVNSANSGDLTLYIGVFWLTGLLAYVLARRPVAAWAAWTVAPLWYMVSSGNTDNLISLALPAVYAIVLGWLMAIGSRITFIKLLFASAIAMVAGRAANHLLLGISLSTLRFRVEDGLGLLLAVLVAWAIARLLGR